TYGYSGACGLAPICWTQIFLDYSWVRVLFEVYRRLIAQSAVEAFWVVKGFDIIKDSRACLVMSLEIVMMEPLGFKSAPEGFHGGIVVAVTAAAHAATNATRPEKMPVGVTGILRSPI